MKTVSLLTGFGHWEQRRGKGLPEPLRRRNVNVFATFKLSGYKSGLGESIVKWHGRELVLFRFESMARVLEALDGASGCRIIGLKLQRFLKLLQRFWGFALL